MDLEDNSRPLAPARSSSGCHRSRGGRKLPTQACFPPSHAPDKNSNGVLSPRLGTQTARVNDLQRGVSHLTSMLCVDSQIRPSGSYRRLTQTRAKVASGLSADGQRPERRIRDYTTPVVRVAPGARGTPSKVGNLESTPGAVRRGYWPGSADPIDTAGPDANTPGLTLTSRGFRAEPPARLGCSMLQQGTRLGLSVPSAHPSTNSVFRGGSCRDIWDDRARRLGAIALAPAGSPPHARGFPASSADEGSEVGV
jgi:hypothetical protein